MTDGIALRLSELLRPIPGGVSIELICQKVC